MKMEITLVVFDVDYISASDFQFLVVPKLGHMYLNINHKRGPEKTHNCYIFLCDLHCKDGNRRE